MTTYSDNTQRLRLTRLQQLTLNTWRWAHTKLSRVLDPSAVLEHAALHAVLASLRDVDTPTELFDRHAHAYPEFSLITSLLAHDRQSSLRYELLDSAFLMRWNELTTATGEPQELPPLRKLKTGNDAMRTRPS
jgi:hypothetical protein